MSPQTEKFYDHLLHVYEELFLLKKEDWDMYLYKNPVLFSKGNSYNVYQSIEAGYFSHIPRLQHLSSEELFAPMQRIIGLSQHFGKNPMNYSFGFGPVERIWEQFEANEISLTYAEKLIKDDSLFISAEIYLFCLCCYCENLAYKGNWRKAISLFKILKTGIEHRNQYPWHDTDKEHIVLTWLELVTRATSEIPDARYFNDAVETAIQFEGKLEDEHSFYETGELFHKLAVIHYDPYFAGKNLSDYTSAFRAWQLKLTYEFGDEIQNWDKKEQQLLSPKEAIPKAIEYGLKASNVRNGLLKAKSIKVVVDAMFAANMLKFDIDTSNLLGLATEAQEIYKNFPNERYAYESLTSIIDYINKTENSSIIDQYLEQLDIFLITDIEELYAAKNKWTLRERIIKIGGELQIAEPEKCLHLLMRHETLMYDGANSNKVNTYFNLMMSCLFNLYIPKSFRNKKGSYEELYYALKESATLENWNIHQITAAQLRICALCVDLNQEKKGIELLAYIMHANSSFVEKYKSIYSHIEALLYIGEAINSFDISDFTEGIKNYIQALRVLLNTKRLEEAKDLLYRIQDIILNADGYDIAYTTVALGTEFLNVQLTLGIDTTNIFHTIFKRLLSKYIHSGNYNTELLAILLQLKKSYRFTSILDASKHIKWTQNKELIALDTQIKKLQKTLAQEEEKQDLTYKKEVLDDHMIIASAYGKPISLKGDSTKDRILNLQQVFDATFQRFLINNSIHKDKFLPTHFVDIQANIPNNTAIIDYTFGQSNLGIAQIYITIITNSDQFITVCNLENIPSGAVEMTYEGKKIKLNLLTYLISEVRKYVIEEPGFKNISTDAIDLLSKYYKQYFGGNVPEILNELRKKGIDHLCIIPCDSLFFYPFHLTGEEDAPIAKDWKISYLPGIQYITKKDTKTNPITNISIFAIKDTEAAPSYLRPLEHVEEEAKTIATIFKVEPIIGNEATEATFYASMSKSKYVHLAAHGEHNVYAPCYHSIYLQPSNNTDGIVNAYEIYGKDFSNVELLTLSACETALGRVDVASNLYGLPAAFFHAGVKTIIGTLWEVETKASAFFFTTFYQILKNTENKLDAFYTAQKETRISFPQYRDWGAFYYMGHF